MRTENYTPETAPVFIYINPKQKGDEFRPMIAMVLLSYQYNNNRETEAGYKRGEKYMQLKQDTEQTLLKRIGDHMGGGFTDALVHHELSTPVTYERYTYSKHGSFMSWSIEQSQYSKFLKQKTDIKDLYLMGKWVFPGFEVAGVMASGYYLARQNLKGRRN